MAYSGGLDSTVLLHAVASLSERHEIELTAAHVHHGLNKDASRWADHCASFAATLGVRFIRLQATILSDSGEGIEQAARQVRFELLDSLGADRVLLAHHADDQAETMLQNLFRGTGVLGMAGIPELRGKYLRPLLALPRWRLDEYAARHGLSCVEDDSNTNRRFTRNYLRHEVMPAVRARFPDFAEKSALAGRRFAEAQQLLNDLAAIDAGDHEFSFPFPANCFLHLGLERGMNLLRCLLTAQGIQSPPEVRVREFMLQLHTAGPDRHPELRLKQHVLRRSRGQLHLQLL